MKKTLSRLLSLAVALAVCLMPLCARAEAPETAIEPFMMTMTIDNISGTVDGTASDAPFSLQIGLGGDLASARAFAMADFSSGENSMALMGSIEDDEVRAYVSGMETGLCMPLEQAAKEAISEVLLWGMNYDEVSEELRAATDEYLALLFESLTDMQSASDGSPLEAFYPRDEWIDEYENYPALLNAVPAGEEEITVFGQTYLAKKYTYSFDRLSEEEYAEHFAAYDEYYYGGSDELDEAYERFYELLEEEYYALWGEGESVWTDDGTISEWDAEAGGSLSEWSEADQYETYYSAEGVIWQVDEILATVDQCTFVWHMPDGDQTETSVYADMLTENAMRTESSSEFSCSHCDEWSTETESTHVEISDSGELVMDTFLSSAGESVEYDYSYSSQEETHMETMGDRMILDVVTSSGYESDTYDYGAPDSMHMYADLTFTPREDSELYGVFSGRMQVSGSSMGTTIEGGADLTITLDPFPEGRLLSLPPESINPLEADEEALESFMTELETVLMQALGSLLPAPETPDSVGGALLG